MSKSYGMAGWRLGFVVGNAEIVERINLLQDHNRAGVFRAVQEAGIAALTGPQDSVEERRARYEARRDRVLEALPVRAVSEGTFYVWVELPEGLTAERLLTEHRLALAPGEGFGPAGVGLGSDLARGDRRRRRARARTALAGNSMTSSLELWSGSPLRLLRSPSSSPPPCPYYYRVTGGSINVQRLGTR